MCYEAFCIGKGKYKDLNFPVVTPSTVLQNFFRGEEEKGFNSKKKGIKGKLGKCIKRNSDIKNKRNNGLRITETDQHCFHPHRTEGQSLFLRPFFQW